ncbi:GlcG/HbpS family heme-binding protein [Actinocorallia populi]|uniref:GlcG/HbpS family heme-binding protein n=1 Tax=Actinocorallia populi TaxID=2079200 RepID=UPI000D08C64B|nr:heme-binding protein [Actinocorallia populi]
MGKRLPLKAAHAAVDAALERAAADGLRIAVAVVDARGADILVARGDGAPWFSPGVARAKAASSTAFRVPSDAMQGIRETYPDLFALIDDQVPHRLTTLPGGLPVRHDGELLGAIGVSGATAEQDVECAQAALDALAVLLASGS